MSEDIKRFLKLYSSYGKYAEKIIEELYTNEERSFNQLLISTKIDKLDMSLTLSFLMQARHIKIRKEITVHFITYLIIGSCFFLYIVIISTKYLKNLLTYSLKFLQME